MKRQWLGVLGLVLSLAVIGCGSSGSSGDPAAAQASCTAYCNTYLAAACATPMYTSASDCQSSECAQAANAPAGCQADVKIYYDCRATQADICGDTGCTSEFAALNACH